MAHPRHQFAGACTGRGGHGVSGVAKVVKAQAIKPDSVSGRKPNPLSEVAPSKPASGRTNEDGPLCTSLGVGVEVVTDLVDQRCRNRHRSAACGRLHLSWLEPPA